MNDLIAEYGDDGNIWLTHIETGCAIEVCRQVNQIWYVAGDDGFSDQVGPFDNIDDLCDCVIKYKLFQPWGSPGN